MNVPHVVSSVLTRVEYDEDAGELDVTFTSGRIYRYVAVPPYVYSDLLDAESKGEYFNENIKDVYDYAEVRSRGKQSHFSKRSPDERSK